MRFDEIASSAGRTAANIGIRAERPTFAFVLARARRRLIAQWSAAVAVSMVVVLVGLWWSGSPTESPVAAGGTATTTINAGMLPAAVELDRETCPVTEPGDTPFDPASSMPAGPPPSYESVWYGSSELWTMVDNDGQTWAELPVGEDGSLSQKTFWWSNDYVLSEELLPDITVTVERLDGSGPKVAAGGPGTNGSHRDLGNFMIVGLEIPQSGCWRVTANYRESTLTYVVWASEE
jgi:hypothetical protein